MAIPLTFLLPILVGFAAFTALWALQLRSRNASHVDVAWAYGSALVGLWFVWRAGGDPLRGGALALLVAVWGARLGTHILRRVHGKAEDSRYASLRAKWGGSAPAGFLAVFWMNALLCLWFGFPVWVAASATDAGLRVADLIGLFIGFGAILGEGVADAQLKRFARDPANKGKVCQTGLWRYSRHPNYFFEWLYWFAFVAAGLGSPQAWATLLAPALMLFFLLRVTGIPATEASSLRSRGDAYRAYQRTTSAFMPWPPRKE